MSDAEREKLHKTVFFDWQNLRHACRLQHKSAPGGAAVCYCGQACGSSPACAMLRTIRDFLASLEPEQVPEMWREWLKAIQRAG